MSKCTALYCSDSELQHGGGNHHRQNDVTVTPHIEAQNVQPTEKHETN